MRQNLRSPILAMCFLAVAFQPLVTDAFTSTSFQTPRFTSLERHPVSLYAKKDGFRTRVSSLFPTPSNGKLASQRRSPRILKLLGKTRRAVATFCTVAMLWFFAAGIRTPPSYASTAPASTANSGTVFSRSLDQMVDDYVQDHMFDDEAYDPVESTYREAVSDKLKGSHPKALSEISASVLGRDGVKADKQGSSASGIGGALLSSINFLKSRGLSESTAIIILAGSFVVAGPIAFVCAGMMVGAQSKRQINSVMKKRYGDTYTVDATIKEDDVEAPDDDEDDEDDEEDDEEDDDEDDE